MHQEDCGIAALVEDAVALTLDLHDALHLFSDVPCKDPEATRTMVLAWRNSIAAQRDLVRGAIRRGPVVITMG